MTTIICRGWERGCKSNPNACYLALQLTPTPGPHQARDIKAKREAAAAAAAAEAAEVAPAQSAELQDMRDDDDAISAASSLEFGDDDHLAGLEIDGW